MGVTFEYTHRSPHPMTGTVLGSRSRPLQPVAMLYSPYREALVGTPKSHLSALFPLRGSSEVLLAVSVHGTNLHPDQRAFDRHMDQIFGRVALHAGPVVVAGDFNTWSESRTDYLFERAAALGLQSVLDREPAAESAGDGRLTWCGNYLDHAFIRGVLLRSGARVLRDVRSSDHPPLSLEIAIADAQGCQGR
jgi:endonuclease/exonuclease/phosphatase (EEP) superfamily protein YafD